MHFIGLGGVPRRYYSNSAYEGFDVFLNINTLITVFAFLAAIAQVIFLFNFVYSIFKGKKAPQNPWHSNTLEWTSPAGPGIHGNWNGVPVFMEIGMVLYQQYIVGLMTIANLEQMMIIFHKQFRILKQKTLTFRVKSNVN